MIEGLFGTISLCTLTIETKGTLQYFDYGISKVGFSSKVVLEDEHLGLEKLVLKIWTLPSSSYLIRISIPCTLFRPNYEQSSVYIDLHQRQVKESLTGFQ